MSARQFDLWGNEVTPFTTARERYGTWPTTVWPIDHSNPETLKLKAAIGDFGKAGDVSQTRDGSFTAYAADDSVYRGKVGASVFSPQAAQWILNMFAPPPPAKIFDPFGGGGTRALLSAASGYQYLGVEIRAAETEASRKKIERNGFTEQARVVTGDSREVHVPPGWADFLITCPPYFNLERYNGPAGDLSMAPTYAAFCQDLLSVVYQTGKALKPGALSCWVVGLLRDDDGTLLPLHADVMRLHEESGGFSLLEEVVLSQVNNGALQRVGNFDKGQHHLIRTHEYLLVFRRKTPL